MRRAWRISNYATLDGTGGERGTGRWHRHARIVYCAEHAATAMLETLVHLEIESLDELPASYQLLEIGIPEQLPVDELDLAALPSGWQHDESLSQRLGMAWLSAHRTAVLRVPSAVMPSEFNLLLNPVHPDAAQFRVLDAQRYPFDLRLVKTLAP